MRTMLPPVARVIVAGAVVVLLIWAASAANVAAARPDPPFLAIGVASATADRDGNVALRLFVANGGTSDVQASLRIVRGATAATPPLTVWSGAVRAPAGASGTVDASVRGSCGLQLAVVLTVPGQTRSLDVLAPCGPTS